MKPISTHIACNPILTFHSFLFIQISTFPTVHNISIGFLFSRGGLSSLSFGQPFMHPFCDYLTQFSRCFSEIFTSSVRRNICFVVNSPSSVNIFLQDYLKILTREFTGGPPGNHFTSSAVLQDKRVDFLTCMQGSFHLYNI